MTRIVAVSYLNTIPFLYGLNHFPDANNLFDISLAYPSECARILSEGKADIGLVPSGSLSLFNNDFGIISDYCIGAEDYVKTVRLFSNVPINEIKKIHLDYQSLTSVKLVKILAAKHWNISPEWVNATPGFEKKIKGNEAAVIIGDRVFDVEKLFPVSYDLAKEWIRLTGLPFVFAVWVSKSEINIEIKNILNQALSFGVKHIDKTISFYRNQYPNLDDLTIKDYLLHNISYSFSGNKKLSLQKFTEYQMNISNL